MNTATMFLSEMTVVDHAFVDGDGNVIGGSFNPSFLVAGDVDPVEKVVVDFSTVKKDLKATIDDDLYGFDHKLWIIEDYSNVKLFSETGERISFDEIESYDNFSREHLITVNTPVANLVVPRDALKIVRALEGCDMTYTIENAGLWMEHYLNRVYPNLNIACRNNIETHTFDPSLPLSYFSYAHGLKDSTSWGCQNIAHGHTSFIQLGGSDNKASARVAELIARELDCTMFINHENVIHLNDSGTQVHIGYQSHSRGKFEAIYTYTSKQKCVVLNTETTIEFLVEYVAERYRDLFLDNGITDVYVSEGLSKGAYKYVGPSID